MNSPADLNAYRQGLGREGGGVRPRSRALSEAVARLCALHTPIAVCRGCCSPHCRGTCCWSDEYGGELLTVCAHCCIDPEAGKQSYHCLDYHEHGAEHGPQTAICETRKILDANRS